MGQIAAQMPANRASLAKSPNNGFALWEGLTTLGQSAPDRPTGDNDWEAVMAHRTLRPAAYRAAIKGAAATGVGPFVHVPPARANTPAARRAGMTNPLT
jgi:hypothetical protein